MSVAKNDQRALAAAAGVSAMTVSRVLAGHASVAPATRARVLLLARERGYRLNPIASALARRRRAGGRGEVLAYLDHFPAEGNWRGQNTPWRYFLGAERRARELGYRLEVFATQTPALAGGRLNRVLAHRGIDGVLVGPFPHPSEDLALERGQFACVAIGDTYLNAEAHRVTRDYFKGLRVLLERLEAAGYRRIGLAVSAEHDELCGRWLWAGYREYMGRRPALTALPVLEHTDRAALAAWRKANRPDCIVSDDQIFLIYLDELGVRVPEQCGFALMEQPNWPRVACAGLDDHTLDAGAAAVDLLVSHVQARDRGVPFLPRTLMIPGTFRPGPTVSGSPAWTPSSELGDFVPLISSLKSELSVRDADLFEDGEVGAFSGVPLGGRCELAGVPFVLPTGPEAGVPGLWFLARAAAKGTVRRDPVKRIPVGRRAAAVQVLHAAGGTETAARLGCYRLIYADGTQAEATVFKAGKGEWSATGGAIENEPNICDVGAACVRTGSPYEPVAVTPVLLPTGPKAWRNLLCLTVWRWVNLHPEREIAAIEIEAGPKPPTAWAVLALTLETEVGVEAG